MRGVFRFGQQGKLKPRFVGPFQIISRVGESAYRLALLLYPRKISFSSSQIYTFYRLEMIKRKKLPINEIK